MSLKMILTGSDGGVKIVVLSEDGLEISVHAKSTLSSSPTAYVSYYGEQKSSHGVYNSIKIIDENANVLYEKTKEELAGQL